MNSRTDAIWLFSEMNSKSEAPLESVRVYGAEDEGAELALFAINGRDNLVNCPATTNSSKV
jgi:hypothetical protein